MTEINYVLLVIFSLVSMYFLFSWGKSRKSEDLALGSAFAFMLGAYVLYDLVIQLSAPTADQTMALIATSVFIMLGGVGLLLITTYKQWMLLVTGIALIVLMIAMIAIPLVIPTLPANWVFTSADGLLRISVPLIFVGLLLYGIASKYLKKASTGVVIASLFQIVLGVLTMIVGFSLYYVTA